MTWISYTFFSFFLYLLYIFIAGEFLFFEDTYGTGQIIYSTIESWFIVFIASFSMFIFDFMMFSFKLNKRNFINYLKKQIRLGHEIDP